MEYNTMYRIVVKSCDNSRETSIEAAKAFFALLKKFDFLEQEIELGFVASHKKPVKWYDCISEIKEFSCSYPNVFFEILGEGEDCYDLWKCYIVNGKRQIARAIISYPEFNADLLE